MGQCPCIMTSLPEFPFPYAPKKKLKKQIVCLPKIFIMLTILCTHHFFKPIKTRENNHHYMVGTNDILMGFSQKCKIHSSTVAKVKNEKLWHDNVLKKHFRTRYGISITKHPSEGSIFHNIAFLFYFFLFLIINTRVFHLCIHKSSNLHQMASRVGTPQTHPQ